MYLAVAGRDVALFRETNELSTAALTVSLSCTLIISNALRVDDQEIVLGGMEAFRYLMLKVAPLLRLGRLTMQCDETSHPSSISLLQMAKGPSLVGPSELF